MLNSGKLHYPNYIIQSCLTIPSDVWKTYNQPTSYGMVRNPIGNSPFRSQDQWEIFRIHGINGATVVPFFRPYIFCGEFMAMKNHGKHQKINRSSHSNFLLVEMVAFMTRKINFDPRHMRFYPEKKTGRDFMNLTQNDIEKHRYAFFVF